MPHNHHGCLPLYCPGFVLDNIIKRGHIFNMAEIEQRIDFTENCMHDVSEEILDTQSQCKDAWKSVHDETLRVRNSTERKVQYLLLRENSSKWNLLQWPNHCKGEWFNENHKGHVTQENFGQSTFQIKNQRSSSWWWRMWMVFKHCSKQLKWTCHGTNGRNHRIL